MRPHGLFGVDGGQLTGGSFEDVPWPALEEVRPVGPRPLSLFGRFEEGPSGRLAPVGALADRHDPSTSSLVPR
jgi:hypothetical protein